MGKITIIAELQCMKCGGTTLKNSSGAANDPILDCGECGSQIGPQSAIEAALRGESHTPIGGAVDITYKELN